MTLSLSEDSPLVLIASSCIDYLSPVTHFPCGPFTFLVIPAKGSETHSFAGFFVPLALLNNVCQNTCVFISVLVQTLSLCFKDKN